MTVCIMPTYLKVDGAKITTPTQNQYFKILHNKPVLILRMSTTLKSCAHRWFLGRQYKLELLYLLHMEFK